MQSASLSSEPPTLLVKSPDIIYAEHLTFTPPGTLNSLFTSYNDKQDKTTPAPSKELLEAPPHAGR